MRGSILLALVLGCASEVGRPIADPEEDSTEPEAARPPAPRPSVDAAAAPDAAPEPPPPDAQVSVDAIAPVAAGGRSPDVRAEAMPDAGPAGASRCAGSGLLLCDGFESGAVDPLWTSRTKNGGKVSVDSVHTARGKFALHAHVAGVDASVGMIRTALKGASRNAFFGRAFFYFQGKPPAANYDYLRGQGSPPGTSVYGSYNLGGTRSRSGPTHHVLSIIHPGHDGIGSTYPMPPQDRWSCWEWEFRGDTRVFRVWIDGQPVPFSQPPVGMVFNLFEIGLDLFHADPTPAFDLWVDEVALNATRIGCDR